MRGGQAGVFGGDDRLEVRYCELLYQFASDPAGRSGDDGASAVV
jgi:hypothetical protein